MAFVRNRCAAVEEPAVHCRATQPGEIKRRTSRVVDAFGFDGKVGNATVQRPDEEEHDRIKYGLEWANGKDENRKCFESVHPVGCITHHLLTNHRSRDSTALATLKHCKRG